MRALRKLLLGETLLLPLGIAAVTATADLILRPLATSTWHTVGGFVLLAAITSLLVVSVARTARRR
jgi:hypothetical protein